MMLSALAIAGSAKAGEPIIVIPSTHAIEDARARAQAAAQAEAARRQASEIWFKTTLAPNALVPRAADIRADYYDYLKRNRENSEEKQRISAVDQLSDGDPIEIVNLYDDQATIKMYLHDSGYIDLSDAEITKISTYMKINHIHHVSQLGQQAGAILVNK